VEELLTTLQAQLATITALTEIIRRERGAIAENELTLLQRCQQEKAEYQQRLRRLEAKRELSADGKSLRELAAVPGAPAEKLLTLRQSLQLALRELKIENETNALYLKHQLAYINCFRPLINTQPTAAYTQTGKVSTRQNLACTIVSALA